MNMQMSFCACGSLQSRQLYSSIKTQTLEQMQTYDRSTIVLHYMHDNAVISINRSKRG